MVQERLHKGTVILLRVAKALETVPEGPTKAEMEEKYQVILAKLAEIPTPEAGACWFGLIPQCNNGLCSECEEYAKMEKEV